MKNTNSKIAIYAFLSLGIIACKSDRDEVDGGTTPIALLKDSYTIDRFKVLNIAPEISANSNLIWSVNDSVISSNLDLAFISPSAKTYPLPLKVETNGTTTTYSSKIIVNKENTAYSKYISKVLEYQPAVGQFINKLPIFETGDSSEKMLTKASEYLIGENSKALTLGGFGGYVVFGFDHTIPNMNGRDFKVLGNAFWANGTGPERTGNCEPGIIMVAYDKNKNGKPDADEWYEIAGSEYFKDSTIKNYAIKYHKQADNHIPVKGSASWQLDIEHVKWEDNQGNSGFKTKNSFNTQSYYPLWFSTVSYTLSGTKIADNYVDQSGAGTFWVGKSYAFGYADNAPNSDEASNIDISWAVDKNGKYVQLPGIDFVKVYTATNQEAGWLGEISTEVAGAYNLFLK